MTNKSIASIALAALVLGALPAAAGQGRHERRDDRLAALAHDLQQATHDLYRGFAQRGHLRSFSQWRTAAALRSLDEQAQRFHASVERRGGEHALSQREFRRLEQAFARVRTSAPALHGPRSLRQGFGRVAELVSRLDTRLARYERHDGHDHARGRDLAHRDGAAGERYAAITWAWRY